MLLSHRKALCVRAAYCDALVPLQLEIEASAAANEVASIWGLVATASGTEVGNPQDQVSLRAFVADVGDEVHRQSLRRALALPPAESSLIKVAGDAVKARTLLPCAECVVAGGGCDHTPFEQAFKLAVGCAAAYYDHFSTLRPRASTVSFSVWPAAQQEDLNDFGYALGGLTTFPNAGASAAVELRVLVESFGVKEFLALPYVLFHECVCHVHQRVVPLVSDRETRENDMFSEGWMDWIALLVLSDSIDGTRPPDPPPTWGLAHSQERIDAAADLHDARAPAPAFGVRKPKSAAQRLMGIRAARTCGGLLREIAPQHKRAAREVLYQMSFDLNASSMVSPEAKEDLVRQFHRAQDHPSISARLHKYCVNNSLGDLL